MKRHEVWRYEYRQNRYMQHITQEELTARTDDVFRNFLTLTGEGKIGLRPMTQEGEFWGVMWTHLLEEMVLRGTAMPHGDLLSPETLPKTSWPEVPDAKKALRGKKYKDGCYLFKYGNNRHLKRMYEHGEIRVAPATFYKDSSLNSAINDDESVDQRAIMTPQRQKTASQIDPSCYPLREFKFTGEMEDVSDRNNSKNKAFTFC